MTSIQITPKTAIGQGQPCFVIAEIGINHNGDMGLAKEMIAAAAQAGADCVKFQNYRTEDFISDQNQSYSYISQGNEVTESMYAMFKRYEIDRDFLTELKDCCDQNGVVFTSTPTGFEGIQDLCAIGTPLLKNGSDLLTNLHVVRHMGNSGLPTILSTGMSTPEEVDSATETFRATGNEKLILLHCTSTYPTPPEDIHLRKIQTLREQYNCPVGLSDHTEGTHAGSLAPALGACVLEKHFTLDKNLTGPDHRFSNTPDEFARLISQIRLSEKMLGSAILGPTETETASREDFRLSCVAARDLPTGHCLTENDISFKRPGTGVPPAQYHRLVGRTIIEAISQNQQIQIHHLDSN